MKELDITSWFVDRELLEKPVHFVKASGAVTLESKIWILENLKGRFFISEKSLWHHTDSSVYFEDPAEVLFYDLRWT